MAIQIGNLNVGSMIYMGTIFDAPISWVVVDKNHAGYPGDSVTLMSQYGIIAMGIDAKETAFPNGNSNFKLSNIFQWLNANGAANAWYQATHAGDTPPNSSGFETGQNGYSDKPGFLHGFTEHERALMLPTSFTQNTANGAETMSGKMFLPSFRELQIDLNAEGEPIAYFATESNRMCYPTQQAINNNKVQYHNQKTNEPAWCWTRTMDATQAGVSCSYRTLTTGTTKGYSATYTEKFLIRPICNITATALVSDTPVNGYYSLIPNTAPSAPNSITVPTSIEGGTSIGVSWGASTDAEGNLAGYVLERSVDGGAWTQIYRGALSSFTDAITFGWTSVTYRVKAYDAFSAESAYTTSATRSVKNNEPPTISGTDGDLGTFGTSFTSQFYTIMDPQADAVSVVERVDGVVKRSYNASLGGSNTFSFAQADWRQVLNGKHTITITATDSKGAQTVRTWTFTKSVTTLTFTITPLPADAMPDRCVVQAVGGFPEGSSLKVEVSNNANDASPFWEDVSAKLGKKHFFANTAKTASAWGFGLRVTLKRNTATGAVWLDYITINYR